MPATAMRLANTSYSELISEKLLLGWKVLREHCKTGEVPLLQVCCALIIVLITRTLMCWI